MGVEFLGAVAGLGILGWLIDRWAGTSPTWTIVGIVLGLVGGGYNFMKQAIRAGREAERRYRRAHLRRDGGDGRTEPPGRARGAGRIEKGSHDE